MIFANPALLALLPLAVVPVVVHLLYKRRRATIELPSLWLLRNVELRLSPRRKLREYLLLAARCLFVAALALAVARPVSRGALGAGAVDYFVVLDNTASMQLQGAFDVATRRAHEVLDSMGAKDRAAILPTVAPDGWSADELTRDRAALRQALRSLVCSDAATDLEPAVENARALAEKATAPQAQVVVLSDYRGPAQRLSRGPVHVDCATPEAESNLALELISVEPAAPLVGRPVDVTVRIASDATDERVCAVGLELSGTPLETRSITVPAGGSTTTSLRIPRIPQVGWTRGRVALPDDGFAPDNAVAFVLKVRERIRAAVVDPDLADPESGGRFLTRLLDPSGDGTTSGIQARRLRPAEPPGEVEALLVCGYATAEGIALRAFAEGGGLVMVFAEEGDAGCDLDWLPAVPGGPVAYPDPTGRLLTVEDLTVVARLDLEARPEAEMLLRFDGRRPALCVVPVGEGYAVSAGFGLAPGWGSFTFHPKIVALLHRLVARYAARPRIVSASAGARVSLAVPGPVEATRDGTPHPVTVEAGRVDLGRCLRAGTYALRGEGDGFQRFVAVNTAVRESVLSRSTDLSDAVGREADLASTLTARRVGTDFSPLFLLAALFFALSEALLANRLRARRATIRGVDYQEKVSA